MREENVQYNFWDDETKKEFNSLIPEYRVLNPFINEETFNLFVKRYNETWYDEFDVLTDDYYNISIYTSNKRGDSEDFNFIVVSIEKSDGVFSVNDYKRTHGKIEGFVLNDIIYYWGKFMFIYLNEETKFTEKNGELLSYTPIIFDC